MLQAGFKGQKRLTIARVMASHSALHRALGALVGTSAVLLLNAAGAAGQSHPCAPTDSRSFLKRMTDHLSSDRAVTFRHAWRIDNVVWHEPVCMLDLTGEPRLITPAHAEIHAAVPFEYDEGFRCPLPQNPAVPSNIRLLVPRDYGRGPVRRWIVVAPPGPSTELTFDTMARNVPPLLRRGYAILAQNSLYPGYDRVPNTLADLAPRFNQGTQYGLEMFSRVFALARPGALEPHFIYGYASGRGANVLAKAIECARNPFDGVLQSGGGSGLGRRAQNAPELLTELRAVDPADDAAMAEYFRNIGRTMTVIRRQGARATGSISAVLDDDLRFFFNIPSRAQILFPLVPGFGSYGINFRFTGASFDTQISGPTITQLTPAGLRSVLADIDPAYLSDVDAGRALLRDWAPGRRGAQVQNRLLALDPTGNAFSQILKIHGNRDGTHYVTLEVEYIQKLIAAGNGNRIRYYFSRNADRTPLVSEDVFVDATGAVQSLGASLEAFDALFAWVERRIEPGDLDLLDSANPLGRRVRVKGAHQLGLQRDPLRYFEQSEGITGAR